MLPARLALLLTVLCGFVLPSHALAAQTPPQATWHGRQIHLYDVQRAGFTGRGVTVAVLDGWIDTSHPDFGRRLAPGADCSSGACTTTMGRDDCGQEHGTHVAGTVTSSSYGVAVQARLMPVRVLTADSTGECTGDPNAVAAGIRWAVAHGARVLNLSLGPDVPGTSTASALPTAVHEAAAAGAVVVFSAGNADLPVAQSYGTDALVVAATGPSGALASYSQHGQGVSVAAPGGEPASTNSCSTTTCVTSLYPDDRYAVAAGTSMAAPHVAGLAALLLAAHPGWTAAQVRDRITATAHPLAGAGAGLVDAAAALGVKVATTRPVPTTTRSAGVRARATTPARTTAVSPAPVRRTTAPQPAPTRATAPSPITVAAPTPSGLPDVPFALPAAPRPERIPLPLAAVAGMLVGLAGVSVLVLPRLR